MELAALRKRAMYDPQSLTQEEWLAIHKAATSTPEKEFYDDVPAPPTPAHRSPIHKQKKKGSWW